MQIVIADFFFLYANSQVIDIWSGKMFIFLRSQPRNWPKAILCVNRGRFRTKSKKILTFFTFLLEFTYNTKQLNYLDTDQVSDISIYTP